MRLTKINEIIKDVESGLSTDAIIGNHVNRRTDNVDDILKVIRDYKWNKWRNGVDFFDCPTKDLEDGDIMIPTLQEETE